MLGVADPIKGTTAEALRELAAEGIRVIMLTGDNAVTAQAVADRLGIATFALMCCRRTRARWSRRLRAEGRSVAMAGDGVNDAPALAPGRSRHRHGNRFRCLQYRAQVSRW
jgi:Cu+-exporting ATPase